jgi:hypothetical protein
MANINSPGRKKLTPIDKAYRAWVRADEAFSAVKSELEQMTKISEKEKGTAKGQEVMLVVKQRLDVNRKLNPVIDSIMKEIYHGDKSPESEKNLESMKKKRAKLYDRLNNMPELGMTQKEWDETPEEFKTKRLGRPRVSIEMQYVRAEAALKEAKIVALQEETAAKAEHKTLSQLKKEYSDASPAVGRPSLSSLDKLDKEIRRVGVLREKALAEVDSFQINADAKGRRPIHPKVRAKSYLDKINDMKRQVAELESTLTNIGRLERGLKMKRRALREMKQKEAAGSLSTRELSKLSAMEEYVEKLSRYRDFAKRVIDGDSIRRPHSIDADTMVMFHQEFIRDDKTFEFLPDSIRTEQLAKSGRVNVH